MTWKHSGNICQIINRTNEQIKQTKPIKHKKYEPDFIQNHSHIL